MEKLKAQKKDKDGRKFDEEIAKKEKGINNLKKKLGVAKSCESDIAKMISELKAKLAIIESEIEEATGIEKDFDVRVSTAHAAYKEAQSENKKLSKTINTEESYLESLRAKLHETLQKARTWKRPKSPYSELTTQTKSLISQAELHGQIIGDKLTMTPKILVLVSL